MTPSYLSDTSKLLVTPKVIIDYMLVKSKVKSGVKSVNSFSNFMNSTYEGILCRTIMAHSLEQDMCEIGGLFIYLVII